MAVKRTKQAEQAKAAGKKTSKAPVKKTPVRKAQTPASRKGAAKPAASKKPAAGKPASKKKAVTTKKKNVVAKIGTKTKGTPVTKAANKSKSSSTGRSAGRKAPLRSPADLAAFRTLLMQKQKDLIQAYTNSRGDSRNRQSDGTEDYIDYAVSSYDREFLLSLTEFEKGQLMLVEEALKKVEQGSGFGLCAQCETPIPTKRLDVQPWAKYCLRCQELDERGMLTPTTGDDDDDDDAEQDGDDDVEYDGEIEPEEGDDDDEPADEDRLLGG